MYENRPIWFDVYEAFPPKYEPRWDRHQLNYRHTKSTSNDEPRKILYKEDIVRAKFFKVYGGEDQDFNHDEIKTNERKVPATYNLFDSKAYNVAQIFINKYFELEKNIVTDNESSAYLFRDTVEALEADGIYLNSSTYSENSDDNLNTDDRILDEKPILKRISLKEIFEKENKKFLN